MGGWEGADQAQARAGQRGLGATAAPGQPIGLAVPRAVLSLP